ncbi:MAG: peptidoglycan DD-metalloendopeptidase family protein [Azonexus sp.]
MIRLFALTLPALLLTGCFSQQPAPTDDRNAAIPARGAPLVQPSGPGYYAVKRGDTLYRIALENGLDYKDLAAWNNLTNPAAINEGQMLRVAPPGTIDSAGGAVVAKPINAGPVIEARSLDQAPAAATAVATPAPATAPVMPAVGNGAKREVRAGKEPYSDEAYARLNQPAEGAKSAETRLETKAETPSAPVAPAAVVAADDVPWLWPSPARVIAPYSDSGNKGLDFGGKAGDSVLAAGDGKVVYAGSGLRGYGELVIVKHNGTYLSAYAHNRKILVKEGQSVSRGQKIAEMGNTDTDSVKLHFEIRKQGKPVDPAQYLPKR